MHVTNIGLPTDKRIPRRGFRVALAYIAVGFAGIFPLLWVEIPPLVDYPNHLARLHVLANYAASAPLQQNYLIEWRLIPNLAIDGIATLLAPLFQPLTAGRLFLALTILLTIGGVAALHRALFGRLSLWPLASLAIAYSLPFAWGLVNFQFSVALCLLCCAAWIGSDRWHPAVRIAAFNLAATLVYLSHLFGYGALVFVIGLGELSRAVGRHGLLARATLRRLALTSLSFALPAVLFLVGQMTSEPAMEPLPLGTWFGDVFSKASALFSAFLFYGGVADLGLILVVASFAAAAALTGRFNISPYMTWPLAGLAVITMTAPSVLHGLFLDARFGFVLGCFAIAGIDPSISRERIRLTLQFSLIAVLAMKEGHILQTWAERTEEYTAFREALQTIAPGSRVLAVHDTGQQPVEENPTVKWYMAAPIFPAIAQTLAWRNIDALAALERDAYSPTLFKTPSAQPLRSAAIHRDIDPIVPAPRVSPAMLLAGADPAAAARIRTQDAGTGRVAFWAGWPERFDYVIVIRYPNIAPTSLAGLALDPLISQAWFDIYRVTTAP